MQRHSRASSRAQPALGGFGCLLQPLQTLSCVVHQVHQAAVEGQDAHLRAELGKEFFVLLCKGLCLFPKVKGLKDVGCDGDIG